MREMMSKIAIVTGAASGIGFQATKLLLDRGWRVAAFDIKIDGVRQSLNIEEDRLALLQLDISDVSASVKAVETVEASFGAIDALLHFAAIWTGKDWRETEPEEWPKLLSVNVTGAFFLARAVAEKMSARKNGSIVLTASDSAKVGGVAGGPAYVASKGAIIGITRSLAKSLGPNGVRVNAVSPGVVETPMTSSWSQTIKNRAKELTPLGRLAQPDDVAAVACFLASDDARFVTGEIVEVNGGFYFD